MRCHYQGTECRRKRQRIQTGNGNSNCHSEAELRVESTRHTIDEAHRNKHCHEDKCGGNQCRSDTIHRFQGGMIGRAIPFIKLCLHSFHHNNSIIHHRSNHQHKSKEGEHIQTESHKVEKGKSTYQRNNNGNHRYQCGTHTLQEQINHQHHQQQCFYQGACYAMDGGIEEVLLALQILHLDSLRQRFRNLLHLGIYLLNNGIGIRTTCLCNRDVHTGAAICFSNEVIVQRT